MNKKKEAILNTDIDNFINSIRNLNFAYCHLKELDINKNICIAERDATRLITHIDDFTTLDEYTKIKQNACLRISNGLENLNINMIEFVKEQKDVFGMCYYTYQLLHDAKLINKKEDDQMDNDKNLSLETIISGLDNPIDILGAIIHVSEISE